MKFRLVAATLAVAFAYSAAHAQGDPAKAQNIVTQVCSACHGSDGNSTIPTNPSLAAQQADYTLKQLMNFKAQAGNPAERTNPVMAGMVAPLSPDDMKNLAAYFADQKAKPRAARNPELVKLGQSIYRAGIASKGVAACAGCHLPDGAGIPAQFPRLAGQHPEYVIAQLRAFRSGERANDVNSMMRVTAGKLADREIAAVAEYVSGLR
ncbi:MAG TPA: c-type cytochrome [Burkholderiales bacterium]|jgi:Cytochrome c553